MRRILCFGLVLALGVAVADLAYAQKAGRAGVRFGVGTDIEGGLAWGGQIDYTLFQDPNAFELGFAVFGGNFKETSDNGFAVGTPQYNQYDEETKIRVFGVIANYLFRHSMELSGPYFVGGVGVGAVSVEWREESATDTSLGPPLPGGGSFQEEEGSTAGVILNVGIGHRINEKFDLRAQVPTFFISGGEDRDGKVIPTFTITAGVGF